MMDTKQRISRFLQSIAFVTVMLAWHSDVHAQQSSHPNIIIFLIDDMGWEDTSVPFSGTVTTNNKKYHTPNMERLAKSGLKFTNAYAAPVCTPTRVSLITGMNVAHHHVTNWTSPLKDNNTDAPDSTLSAADWNINGFSPVPGVDKTVHATALPQLLKDAGYFTIHVGKAHWGPQGTPGANPYNVGFIVNISGHAAGHPQSYLSEDNYGNLPGKNSAQSVPDLEQYYQSGTFLTEALTQEAIRSLEYPVSKKQPFFLNFGHYAVHVPLMADKRYYQHYLDKGLDSAEAKYASLIEGMDKSLGDVLNFVEKKGIKNNTVILFLSDNGGLALAPPRGGEPFTQNAPLRAGKGSVYEGGIRVPFIIQYPLLIKAGGITDNPVIVEDIFPAILELAGIRNYHSIQKTDGKSFVPVLKNPALTDTSRLLLWHYPNNWQAKTIPGTNYFSALRKGRWKLIYNQRNNTTELYDLSKDLGEEKNVATVFPAKTKELLNLLGRQLKDYNAPMPVDKKTAKPLPYPGDNSN
ncbi:MAG: sulfatase [Chitinophagaceae bacterium]|nr:sulfatase [Chitinophagaceae bacterium]